MSYYDDLQRIRLEAADKHTSRLWVIPLISFNLQSTPSHKRDPTHPGHKVYWTVRTEQNGRVLQNAHPTLTCTFRAFVLLSTTGLARKLQRLTHGKQSPEGYTDSFVACVGE
jgi:hypothetical protein